ncbi:MAG: heavy metal translocating P-type ATPase metal-binding domain-containing protein [Arenimonas sp.]
MNARLARIDPATQPDTTCLHCGQLLPADASQVVFAGLRRAVCCAGCAAAAAWIENAGLADYCRLRSAPGSRVDPAAADLIPGSMSGWDDAGLQAAHVRDAGDGVRETTLALEGLNCAACAWLVDRALAPLPGVRSVSVNAITGRLQLRWEASVTSLSTLVARLAALGYRAHLAAGATLEAARRRERNTALLRLGVAALVATQAMMFSEALYFDAGAQMPTATRDLFRWLAFALTTPVVFYSGWPLLAGLARELRARTPGMDTLAGGSVLLAYVASTIETLRGGAEVWFDAAAMFVLFLGAARLLETFARQRAGAQLDLLARAQPVLACRVRDDAREWVATTALATGDEIEVLADQAVPADGTLLGGAAHFEEALLTGESSPVLRAPGATVLAGSVCREGAVRVRVTAAGSHTRLSELAQRTAQAQAQRPPLAALADRIAARFVVALLVLATAALLYWGWAEPARAVPVVLAVLVAACPCALSLATPAALSAATGADDRLRRVFDLLPEVRELAGRRAATPSGGQQKLVAWRARS